MKFGGGDWRGEAVYYIVYSVLVDIDTVKANIVLCFFKNGTKPINILSMRATKLVILLYT